MCRACCLIRARETTVKSMHDHPSERRAASAPTKSRYAQNCSLFPKGNRSPASPAHLKKTTHTFFFFPGSLCGGHYWRRRHHAWSLGQRRWRLFAEVAVFAQASRLTFALRLPCRAPWASELPMIGSSGAVTVLFVPTNAPRLVGRPPRRRPPSTVLHPREKGGPRNL